MDRRFKNALEVYQTIWQQVSERMFDRSKLAGWAQWKHRFDGRIQTFDDALRFADEAVQSLGDEYTLLYDSTQECQMRLLGHRQGMINVKHCDNGIGYLWVDDFMSDDIAWQLQRAFSRLVNFNALILDLRGNPGGKIELALDCCQLILAKGSLGYLKQRIEGGRIATVSFGLTPDERIVTQTIPGLIGKTTRDAQKRRLQDVVRGKPMVVLVDAHTASAAEMLAQALKEQGIIVVGEQTVGKGIGQDHIRLNGLGVLQITTCHYYSPCGHWLGDAQKERYGVTPSPGFAVAGTLPVEEFLSAGDVQFAAAVQHLEKQLSARSIA
jgi:C-terminal processing protease CtpA/Prc